MPEAAKILENLQAIVDQGRVLSPVVRLCLVALVVLFFRKRRLYATWIATFVAFAAVATSLMAVGFVKYINLADFAPLFVLGLLWGREALTFPPNPKNSKIRLLAAAPFVLAALFYPHFVKGFSGALLLAPLGVVPCPTLILANAAVIASGRTYSLYTVIPTWLLGAWFGLIGVFYLGVNVDFILLAAVPVSVSAFLLARPEKTKRRGRLRRRR